MHTLKKYQFLKKNLFFQYSLLVLFALFYSNGANAQTVINFGGLETPTVLFSENFDGNWTTPNTLSPAWSQVETGDRQWHKNNYTTGWSSTSGSYSPSGANSSTGSARFHSSALTTQFNQNTQGKILSPVLSAVSYDISVTVKFYFNNSSGDDYLSLSYNSWAANGSQPNVYTPIYISKAGTNTSNSITTNWAQLESNSFVIPANNTFQIVFSGVGGLSTTTDIGIDEISISYVRVNNQKWTVPQNVYCIQAEVWGGGGSGGLSNSVPTSSSGGGGGGSYAKDTLISVVPGEIYNYGIGMGGIPLPLAFAGESQGKISYFGNPIENNFANAIIYAQGGGFGSSSEMNPGNNGGWPSAGQPFGDITFKGGYGGASLGGVNAFAGAGGTSAGTSQNGNFTFYNNTSGSVPLSVSGGADGVASFSGRGVKGNPGGGGGSGSTYGRPGGQGGIGNVRITYFSCDQVIIPNETYTSSTLVCPNENFNLSIQFSQNYRCLDFQWFSSIDGLTYLPMLNSTDQEITTSQIQSSYYYCQVICGETIIGNSPPVFVENHQTPALFLNTSTITSCQNSLVDSISIQPFNQENLAQYQWYSSENNSYSNGSAILNENENNYTPSTDSSYNIFYYCAVYLPNSGCTINSPSAQVTIYSTPTITPSVEAQQSICSGGSPQINVLSSNGANIDTYQWYSNNVQSTNGATLIPGAISNSYSIVIDSIGTYYFFSKVCETVYSPIITISVVSDPEITLQPSIHQTICEGGEPDEFSVSVQGGTGTFAYQWYSNNDSLNYAGTPIADANYSTFNAGIQESIENQYYYTIVSNSGNGCNSINSNIATINIIQDPIVSINKTAQFVCVGGTINPLNIVYTGGFGEPQYQWFYTSLDNPNEVLIQGANSNVYAPIADSIFSYSYFCLISTSAPGCSAFSGVSEINVIGTANFENQNMESGNYCLGTYVTDLSVVPNSDLPNPIITWYINASASPMVGTDIPGATDLFYHPSSSSTGDYYYSCSLNYPETNCPIVYSEISHIKILNDLYITQSSDPSNLNCINSSSNLFVVSNQPTENSYEWYSCPDNSTNNGTLMLGENNSNIITENNELGIKYFYCRVINDSTICQTTNSPLMQVNTISQPSISSDNFDIAACLNNEISPINISGNFDSISEINFYHSNSINQFDGDLISSQNYIPLSNQIGLNTYYFTYNVSYPGCLADTSDFYNVTISEVPQLDLGSTEPIIGCVGAEIDLSSLTIPNLNNDYILVWSVDNSTSDTTYASSVYSTLPIETSGSHNLQVQMLSTLQYCSATDELNLLIDIVPDPSITEEQNFIQDLCPFDENINAPTVLLDFDNSIGPPTYTWNQVEEGVPSPLANSNQNSYLPQLPVNGVFNSQCVIQFDYPGCDVLTSSLSTLTFDENNLDCFPELVIPEAISPNNDGMNDFWTITGIEQFNGYEINIFNSFGQSIYFVKNTSPNWDGTWNGQTLPNGDYFFSVKLDELNRTLFGTISIAK